MFKRLLAAVRDAFTVPFTPGPVRHPGPGRPGTPQRTPRRVPRPAGTAGLSAVPASHADDRARFDALIASIGDEELAAMEQSFTRSAVAYAPAPGDVAAIRSLFSATRLLGCEHDAERGSLRLATAYGDVVVATASPDAPVVASRFVPGECSVMIVGHGRNTNLVAAGPGWQFWVEIASLNFDPGAVA